MPKQRLAVRILSGALVIIGSGVILAQNYPTKPIRFVTGGTGSNADFAARLIGPGITAILGQQVIVENRGHGVIIGEIVARSMPDAYTLLVYGTSFWLAPFLRNNVPFDPVKDFAPITLATRSPNVLVVHPSVAAASVKELIAVAKAQPGKLNYASSGTATSSHLAGELLKAMAGVDIVRVNYKSAGLALNDLIGGQVQVMIPNAAGAAGHVKSGRLRALAVTSAQPTALAPGLPTVAASGLPGFEAEVLTGVFAPAKTPTLLLNLLNDAITQVLDRADTKQRFFSSGVEAVGGPPERLATAMKAEMVLWGKLIKDTGIRDE